ncbi:MAG TPA: TldD/PmbA family protein [Candidatus Saccharimonadales bacterium]
MSISSIDKDFLNLPYEKLADAALAEAKKLKASYADFRFERLRRQNISLRDARVENVLNDNDIGYAVRLIVDGAWGFASSSDLSLSAVKRAVKDAVQLAKASRALTNERVELAPEPSYNDTYVSDYEINPFEVDLKDKVDHLSALANLAQSASTINHTVFEVEQALENKFFLNLEGSSITQQRVRVQGNLTAINIDRATGRFESMRTTAAPVGRGWEWFTSSKSGYDYASKISRLPGLIQAKVAAPSVKPGKYDLVIDPTNLFLTIHESVGHATELDRSLGYEANYAGTSFATVDKLGKLQYGSKLMNITGDRTAEHGLSTVGYDDEGVKAQAWDIIKDGKLVGYQLNRQMAGKMGKTLGVKRSNGCAYGDSFLHPPLQRMPNVSLQPSKEDVSTADLISRVDDGIYIVGDNSWSIDMQRYNFQFTGQRFYKITRGQLDGQLKDVAYQANTIDFWNSLSGLGGASTYVLGGAFNCGKGQPGQVAPVSHGAPSALFSKVNVLNTQAEGK